MTSQVEHDADLVQNAIKLQARRSLYDEQRKGGSHAFPSGPAAQSLLSIRCMWNSVQGRMNGHESNK
ncbi:hypothetical protein GOP47_0026384 [Adiantum capillus-veneris]|nr:hypothetical protein GOP47_0026384 [Adiantum capillus-veneris]